MNVIEKNKDEIPEICAVLFDQQGATRVGCKETNIDWRSIKGEEPKFTHFQSNGLKCFC